MQILTTNYGPQIMYESSTPIQSRYNDLTYQRSAALNKVSNLFTKAFTDTFQVRMDVPISARGQDIINSWIYLQRFYQNKNIELCLKDNSLPQDKYSNIMDLQMLAAGTMMAVQYLKSGTQTEDVFRIEDFQGYDVTKNS